MWSSVSKKKLGEGLAKLGLANAGGAEKKK